MELNTYQVEAGKTAIYPEQAKIVYPALGLCGEAGEAAEKIKKVVRDNGGSFDEEHKRLIALELGDVMWYVAALANDLGYSLETIADMNLEKLRSRQNRGVLNGSGDER